VPSDPSLVGLYIGRIETARRPAAHICDSCDFRNDYVLLDLKYLIFNYWHNYEAKLLILLSSNWSFVVACMASKRYLGAIGQIGATDVRKLRCESIKTSLVTVLDLFNYC
jgi:hypothetical protein